MTNYEEKEVKALASMLVEQLDRETVDKFVEDEHGDLARIETYSLYEVAKSLYKSGCRVLSGNGKPRILAHKILSDETLLGMKKTDLIEYIRVLEHNWAATEQSLDQQAKNMEVLYSNARCEIANKLRKNITAAIDSNIKAMSETKSEELYFTCNGKKTACQGILDYIDELVGEEG